MLNFGTSRLSSMVYIVRAFDSGGLTEELWSSNSESFNPSFLIMRLINTLSTNHICNIYTNVQTELFILIIIIMIR